MAVPQSEFTYDALSNPLIYRGKQMSWTMGRNLAEYSVNTYDYNASGIRTTKIANGVQTTYYLDGNKIIAEERKYPNTSNIIDTVYYHYGIDGIAGFEYNGNNYTFRKNIQGDITHIYTADGELLVQYAYDAWGNCQAYAKKGYEELAERNPYRFRGYYYDTETKLYYLNSRYYDPEIGRFINADDISYLDPETINGLNPYAYCGNNPVMAIDPEGHAWWHWLIGAAVVIGIGIALVATAGGAAGAFLAIGAVVNGLSAATVATTVLATAFVASATIFAGVAIAAGVDAIGTWATGGSFSDGWNTAMDYGEMAMWGTVTAGAVGAIYGYAMYKEQNSFSGTKTPGNSTPNSTYTNTKDKTITHYDSNGDMSWSKHLTDHGNPLIHNAPHWHLEDSINHLHSSPLNSKLDFIIEFLRRIWWLK